MRTRAHSGGEATFAKWFPFYVMTDMQFTEWPPRRWGGTLTTANDLDRPGQPRPDPATLADLMSRS